MHLDGAAFEYALFFRCMDLPDQEWVIYRFFQLDSSRRGDEDSSNVGDFVGACMRGLSKVVRFMGSYTGGHWIDVVDNYFENDLGFGVF